MAKALGSLNVGDKIEIPVNSAYQSRFGSKIVFKVADKNHAGYPSGAVTLITDGIIQIMTNDGKEENNSDSNRKSYGNNRHIHANILQWLNSNADAGAWYSAQHSADAPPSAANISSGNSYDTWAGFLAMLPANFANALMTTTLTVARNTVIDGGGSETFSAKIFLASTTEVGLANENSIAEGSLLALFSDNASRIAYPTTECVNNSNGYTSASYGVGKAHAWWLRTPGTSNTYYVRSVLAAGTLYSTGIHAYAGYFGIRPLCNLPSNVSLSDTVNASGNYEIIAYNTQEHIDVAMRVMTSSTRSRAVRILIPHYDFSTAQSITWRVCNNYNDASPAWETAEYGKAHTFTNTTKTAGQWTVGLRVTARDGEVGTLVLGEPSPLVEVEA